MARKKDDGKPEEDPTKTQADSEAAEAAAVAKAIAHRARTTAAMRKARAMVNEIGELPPVKDPARRAACERDFHRFLVTYFPQSCGLAPYGEAQLKAIKRMEAAVLHGGKVINLLPRGYTKSTLSEMLILWAVLYGHKRFALFVGANTEQADSGIESIRSELVNNPLLFEDFPDPCYVCHLVNGQHQRARSMLYRGIDVEMEWTSSKLVLPSLGGSVGAIIATDGLLSATRGARATRKDSTKVRPDIVVLDDIETEQSAVSPSDIKKRLKIITHSLSRLGGHGRQACMVMNATMLAEGSVTDQLSDRKKFPGWVTTRASTVEQMPTNLETLWLGQYADILKDYDEDDPMAAYNALLRASQFYENNREAMDAGHKVSWEDIPLEPGEISAIQHALNVLIIDGRDVFDCEIQNMPKRPDVSSHLIVSHSLLHRTNGLPRGIAPENSAFMTWFVDVHDEILYWARVACRQDFTGSIIDYGSWPQQPAPYFMHSNIKRTLADHYKCSVEDAVRQGLVHLINNLSRHDLELSNGLIDAGYQPTLVEDAIRIARNDRVYSSKGLAPGPTEKAIAEYDLSPKRSLRAGPDPARPSWYFPREFWRRVHFDANIWKSFTSSRLTQSAFESAAITLWGDGQSDHSMIVDHCMSERPIAVTARGRTVNVWKRSNRENHYWDCVVGCMVAASIAGCELRSVVKTKPRTVRRVQPRRSYGASDLNC